MVSTKLSAVLEFSDIFGLCFTPKTENCSFQTAFLPLGGNEMSNMDSKNTLSLIMMAPLQHAVRNTYYIQCYLCSSTTIKKIHFFWPYYGGLYCKSENFCLLYWSFWFPKLSKIR